MSVLPSFAERKRVWVFRRCTLSENQLTKFSAGDAGDFNEAAGEREMAPKCGSLPRDAGDLAGLRTHVDH